MDHDLSLVERIRQGDRGAFGQVVELYQKPLFYFALRWTRSKADAEDVVQKAFLNAYTGIRSYRGHSSLKTWLFQIALNLLKNEARSRKVRKEEEIGDTIPCRETSPLDQSMTNQETTLMLKMVDRLKPKQKATLLLRVFQDLSFREVALAMSCSENTAKVNFHYALSNLRQMMINEGYADEMPLAKNVVGLLG